MFRTDGLFKVAWHDRKYYFASRPNISCHYTLKKSTLVLLPVDAVVLPDSNGRNSEDEDGCGGNTVVLLVLAIGVVDCVSDLTSNRVGHLSGVSSEVNGSHVGLSTCGKRRLECIGEGVGVDGSTDG